MVLDIVSMIGRAPPVLGLPSGAGAWLVGLPPGLCRSCLILGTVSPISQQGERESRSSADTFIHVARILVPTVSVLTMVIIGSHAPDHKQGSSTHRVEALHEL